jgi:hypothetical protein
MGERWKKMTDKEKKPYFDLARKYQQEHKQVQIASNEQLNRPVYHHSLSL